MFGRYYEPDPRRRLWKSFADVVRELENEWNNSGMGGNVGFPMLSSPYVSVGAPLLESFSQPSSRGTALMPWHSQSGAVTPAGQGSLMPFGELPQMKVDIVEKPNAFEITAELPGFEPQMVKAKIDNGVLKISAKQSHKAQTGDEHFKIRERTSGSVIRLLKLPDNADIENIHASHEHGVLTVHIPKRQQQLSLSQQTGSQPSQQEVHQQQLSQGFKHNIPISTRGQQPSQQAQQIPQQHIPQHPQQIPQQQVPQQQWQGQQIPHQQAPMGQSQQAYNQPQQSGHPGL